MEFNETWQEASTQHATSSIEFVFIAPIITSVCSIPKSGTKVHDFGPLVIR